MGYCLECGLTKSKKGKQIPGKIVPAKEGSSFCEACQPVASDPAVLRSGYFVASHDRLYGDLEFATEAREIFSTLGFSKGCEHEGCSKGDSCEARYYRFAGRFDSVSIFQKVDGSVTKRISLHDFFSLEFKVLVRDVP
jgi:hypothetical protein